MIRSHHRAASARNRASRLPWPLMIGNPSSKKHWVRLAAGVSGGLIFD
jgi:hypothetical protein